MTVENSRGPPIETAQNTGSPHANRASAVRSASARRRAGSPGHRRRAREEHLADRLRHQHRRQHQHLVAQSVEPRGGGTEAGGEENGGELQASDVQKTGPRHDQGKPAIPDRRLAQAPARYAREGAIAEREQGHPAPAGNPPDHVADQQPRRPGAHEDRGRSARPPDRRPASPWPGRSARTRAAGWPSRTTPETRRRPPGRPEAARDRAGATGTFVSVTSRSPASQTSRATRSVTPPSASRLSPSNEPAMSIVLRQGNGDLEAERSQHQEHGQDRGVHRQRTVVRR